VLPEKIFSAAKELSYTQVDVIAVVLSGASAEACNAALRASKIDPTPLRERYRLALSALAAWQVDIVRTERARSRVPHIMLIYVWFTIHLFRWKIYGHHPRTTLHLQAKFQIRTFCGYWSNCVQNDSELTSHTPSELISRAETLWGPD